MDNQSVVNGTSKNLDEPDKPDLNNVADQTPTILKPETLNVKVKVRKKDNKELFSHGFITNFQSAPKMVLKNVRLVNSKETIMSFDICMEANFEKKTSPKTCRHIFDRLKPGICLGIKTRDKDDLPYMPEKSDTTPVCNSASTLDRMLKRTPLTKTAVGLNCDENVFRSERTFLGSRCKPGGCLDPPFDEDYYAYKPKKENNNETVVFEQNRTSFSITDSPEKDILIPGSEKSKTKESKNRIESHSILSIFNVEEAARKSVITYPPDDDDPLRTRVVSKHKRYIESNISKSRHSSENKSKQLVNDSINSFFNPPKSLKRDSIRHNQREQPKRHSCQPKSIKTIPVSKPSVSQSPSLKSTPLKKDTEKTSSSKGENNIFVVQPQKTDLNSSKVTDDQGKLSESVLVLVPFPSDFQRSNSTESYKNNSKTSITKVNSAQVVKSQSSASFENHHFNNKPITKSNSVFCNKSNILKHQLTKNLSRSVEISHKELKKKISAISVQTTSDNLVPMSFDVSHSNQIRRNQNETSHSKLDNSCEISNLIPITSNEKNETEQNFDSRTEDILIKDEQNQTSTSNKFLNRNGESEKPNNNLIEAYYDTVLISNNIIQRTVADTRNYFLKVDKEKEQEQIESFYKPTKYMDSAVNTQVLTTPTGAKNDENLIDLNNKDDSNAKQDSDCKISFKHSKEMIDPVMTNDVNTKKDSNLWKESREHYHLNKLELAVKSNGKNSEFVPLYNNYEDVHKLEGKNGNTFSSSNEKNELIARTNNNLTGVNDLISTKSYSRTIATVNTNNYNEILSDVQEKQFFSDGGNSNEFRNPRDSYTQHKGFLSDKSLTKHQADIRQNKRKTKLQQPNGSISKINDTIDLKQNLSSSPDILSKDDCRSISLNLAFHSYLNDKNEQVIKTVDSGEKVKRYPNDSFTLIKSQINKSSDDKIKIPIDSNLDMAINIIESTPTVQNKTKSKPIPGFILGNMPSDPNNLDSLRNSTIVQHKAYGETNDTTNRKTFNALTHVYEHELIPLQILIRNLKEEVDALATHQQVFKRVLNLRKYKPQRIYFNRRCGPSKL